MDIRVLAQQTSPTRSSEGTLVALRALRDGAMIVVPWYQALVLEGRCFQVSVPSTFDVTGNTPDTTYDDAARQVAADIPDGTVGIPLFLEGTVFASGAVTNIAGIIGTALNGTGGTETLVISRNMGVDNPLPAAAEAMHTISSATDFIDATERVLFHYSTARDVDAIGTDPQRKWTLAEAGVAPVAIDAASINLVHATGATATAFSILAWAELPESAIV